ARGDIPTGRSFAGQTNHASSIYQRSDSINERVTSFLRAIHRQYSRWNHTCVPDKVRGDFLDNAVGLDTVRPSDSSGDASSGHLADGKLHASLDQCVHFTRLRRFSHRTIDIDLGRLFGFRIAKFGLLGELLAVLRPNRVVISKRCGLVTRNDYNGQVVILQPVNLLV